MTTPAERTRALLDAAELLEALAYRGTYHGDDIKPVGHNVRRIAERVLRHYPTVPEIERGAEGIDP